MKFWFSYKLYYSFSFLYISSISNVIKYFWWVNLQPLGWCYCWWGVSSPRVLPSQMRLPKGITIPDFMLFLDRLLLLYLDKPFGLWVLSALQLFTLFRLFNFFYLSVTCQTFVDEICVWHLITFELYPIDIWYGLKVTSAYIDEGCRKRLNIAS